MIETSPAARCFDWAHVKEGMLHQKAWLQRKKYQLTAFKVSLKKKKDSRLDHQFDDKVLEIMVI